jgi:hypothetical protein
MISDLLPACERPRYEPRAGRPLRHAHLRTPPRLWATVALLFALMCAIIAFESTCRLLI